MKPSVLAEIPWARLSDFIAEKLGLHFPSERWSDLQRGLTAASAELAFADVAACVDWVLAAPLTKAQLQVLASHLTVGETYFFREKKTFDALAESILPDLIRRRRNGGRRLRLWSAACCTGEEPYSLAVMLHQLIPDLPDWQVNILATDVNEQFLQKAVVGVYGEWSFRESPVWLKERYFQPLADGRYAVLPQIKRLVTFTQMNLVEGVYPSLATDTPAMDVIFCRNVLMYFTPGQALKVIKNLHRALPDGGWLAVSPSEGSPSAFSDFVHVNFPGVILYQKSGADPRTPKTMIAPRPGELGAFTAPVFEAPAVSWSPQIPPALPEDPRPIPSPETPVHDKTSPSPEATAAVCFQQGRYAEAADTLLASFTQHGPPGLEAFSLLARALANQGKLSEALAWCERWIAAEKLNASAHYLRAVVAQELGEKESARRSLQRAVYLQPGFVLAHFALGNLAREGDKPGEADKHYANALHLLRGCQPNEALSEADGLTAGRLVEIIHSLSALGVSP